jgi:hypothetical protein
MEVTFVTMDLVNGDGVSAGVAGTRRDTGRAPPTCPELFLSLRVHSTEHKSSNCPFISPSLTVKTSSSMFSRLSQLARHLIRPLPNHTYRFAAHNLHSLSVERPSSSLMATDKKLIETAGCIIIGDEVLGGKVRAKSYYHPALQCNWSR